jgi:rRNA-processing protein EBP2
MPCLFLFPLDPTQEGLLQKIEDIALPRDWLWVETLDVHSTEPIDVDDNDDLKREAAFYASSLDAVKIALDQLKQADIPFERPLDYYAESVKPDSHMSKIKQILINDKKRLQEVEERKRQREVKKYAKQVHVERVKERAKAKRDALDEIDRLKTKYKHNDLSSAKFKASLRGKGGSKDDGADDGADAASRGRGLKRNREEGGDGGFQREDRGSFKRDDRGGEKRNFKREAKDAKYGRGGRKTGTKKNTAESAADMSSYSARLNKTPMGQFAKKKGGRR